MSLVVTVGFRAGTLDDALHPHGVVQVERVVRHPRRVRAHPAPRRERPWAARSRRANFTGLVLGCIEAKLILQENMHWKALGEIYTMHSFAQLCNINFLSNICQHFCKIQQNSANLAKFLKIFANFRKILAFLFEKM